MITVIQMGLGMCMVAAVGDSTRFQAGLDILIEVVFARSGEFMVPT